MTKLLENYIYFKVKSALLETTEMVYLFNWDIQHKYLGVKYWYPLRIRVLL